jgi:hypothetical protein
MLPGDQATFTRAGIRQLEGKKLHQDHLNFRRPVCFTRRHFKH